MGCLAPDEAGCVSTAKALIAGGQLIWDSLERHDGSTSMRSCSTFAAFSLCCLDCGTESSAGHHRCSATHWRESWEQVEERGGAPYWQDCFPERALWLRRSVVTASGRSLAASERLASDLMILDRPTSIHGRTGNQRLVLLVACMGSLAVGVLTVLSLSLVVAIGLVWILGGLAYVIVGRLATEASQRRFLQLIFAAALALRLSVSVFTYYALPYGYLAPDERGYFTYGAQIVGSGAPLADALLGEGWLYFNAMVVAVFGPNSELLPRLWNAIIGSLVPVLCYLLATKVGATARAARLAAALTCCFPSLVLWSSLNVKDGDTYVLILWALLIGLDLQKQLRVRDLVLLVAILVVIFSLREYLVLPLMASIVLAQLVARRHILAKAWVLGIVLALLVPLFLWLPGLSDWLLRVTSIDTLSSTRLGFAYGAQSAFIPGLEAHSPIELLGFLPTGLLYFLLGPFPWSQGSTLQLITAPEMLLYYVLLPFIVAGVWRSLAMRPMQSLPVVAFLGITVVGYALTVANFGTVYRLRGQILIGMLSFAAIGLASTLGGSFKSRRSTAPPTAHQTAA